MTLLDGRTRRELRGADHETSRRFVKRLRATASTDPPGYGFLAENADFARACELAGISFVGPTPRQLRPLATRSHPSTWL